MSLDLSQLSRADAITALEQLVFTAARDWKRSVKIDRPTRDWLVLALSEAKHPTLAKTLGRTDAVTAQAASHQDREG